MSAAARPQTPAPLREYQWTGVDFLLERHAALLADEMGLGKTVQTSVAVSMALRRTEINRVLIVCPSALMLNWERELAKWAPSLVVRRLTGPDSEREAAYLLPIPVLIGSYEQIRTDALERIPSSTFDLVVLDEAQRIKNRGSRTAFACRLLPRSHAWALSATPLENSRRDLESVFEFLRPGLLNRDHARNEVLERIQPYFLRRRKRDVLSELPPVIIQDVILELKGQQREAYDDVWLGREAALSDAERPVSAAVLLGLITHLKQLCNFEPTSGESAKFEALRTLVENLAASDDKAIVFSQYVRTLEWLGTKLTGVATDYYHGGRTAEQRDESVTRFETESGPRLLFVSLKAGGVGLNLQAASHVVLFDRWWNPAVENQAMYRAHRFDRGRPLHVLRFLVRDSVEERIADILGEKQQLFEDYVEEAAGTATAGVSRDDLLRVLGVRPASVD